MKNIIFGLLSGLLFGAGLVVSSMVDPVRVIGFLDIFGAWDPTLAFVMGGGLLVYLPVFYGVIKPRNATVFNTPCDLPNKTAVDKKLLLGATIFGIGWGLSGICPGPAITNLSALHMEISIFVLTMLVGMMLGSKMEKYL